jgi:hypothetical protein
MDVDLALQRIVGVGQSELALTPAEERLEHAVKVALDRGERLEEHGAGGAVDLPDRLDQRLPGAHEVVPLAGEELEPLHLFGVLFHGQGIHRADGLEGFGDPGRLRLEGLQIEVQRRGTFQELIEWPVPLGLDPLHDTAAASGRFGEPHLQRVALLIG